MAVPESVALPFGTFERTLEDPVNSDAALGISACMNDLEVSDPHMCSHHSIRAKLAGSKYAAASGFGIPCRAHAALSISGSLSTWGSGFCMFYLSSVMDSATVFSHTVKCDDDGYDRADASS